MTFNARMQKAHPEDRRFASKPIPWQAITLPTELFTLTPVNSKPTQILLPLCSTLHYQMGDFHGIFETSSWVVFVAQRHGIGELQQFGIRHRRCYFGCCTG
jgi:hypothetical protein